MRHPGVVVVRGVIHAIVARETEVDDRSAEMIEEYGVIGAAADARFDECAVEWRTARFRIAHRRGAPGVVQGFSGRRANLFRRFHEHGREESYGGGGEARALGARRTGGSRDGFIHVDIGDEFLLEVVCELLAPFRRAGESVFFAIPTANNDGAARADTTLLEFAKRTRQLHHGSR